ncbi:MAG: hypothetical protein HeimC3_31400 [Candidatus Heimdallarchaeota archaeon LC_3]|nr:MAG: hypothetical protein HeimC3_31400 [Candidatus Heimdallarchaeota archaeon LC_3]
MMYHNSARNRRRRYYSRVNSDIQIENDLSTDERYETSLQPHFCSNCGNQFSINDRFCVNCGLELEK